jgi:hypothetical protein
MRLHAAAGTIDRPLTRDPSKQAQIFHSTEGTPPTGTFTRNPGATGSRQNRTREMQLIPEALARAHLRERLYEAESERLGRRLVQARRLQQRAERASLRARRAIALVVMQ